MVGEVELRDAAFAWLRAQMLTQPVFTRDELGAATVLGTPMRLVGTQTGIWKPRALSAALSILTGYYAEPAQRPYEDGFGSDGLLRYKWRGTDPNQFDNRSLRAAMQTGVPLIWFVGVGYRPGWRTQVFQPIMPVWLIGEEPDQHQFVVALEQDQRSLIEGGALNVSEIERSYNERIAQQRLHQPVFRASVLHAYQRRCAVCRLPFERLLDAAHIQADSAGGAAAVTNGLALCKIHHGAFDTDIMGINPDYRIAIRDEVLDTIDGPTLQHALKGMHGERLGQLPGRRAEQPDRELLDIRFQHFLTAHE